MTKSWSTLMTTTEVANVEPQVTVNGQAHPLGEVGGHVTLLEWLRAAGFTGCKEGCAEGECGACAVLVARPDGERVERQRWTAINACLVPAAGLDNQEVITAEGLGRAGALHPVQQRDGRPRRLAMRLLHTGFHLLDGLGVLPRGPQAAGSARASAAETQPHRRYPAGERPGNGVDPTPGHAPDHEHGPNGFDLHALSGNLCRCTGYRPIQDAAYALGAPDDRRPAVRPACAEPAPAAPRPP